MAVEGLERLTTLELTKTLAVAEESNHQQAPR